VFLLCFFLICCVCLRQSDTRKKSVPEGEQADSSFASASASVSVSAFVEEGEYEGKGEEGGVSDEEEETAAAAAAAAAMEAEGDASDSTTHSAAAAAVGAQPQRKMVYLPPRSLLVLRGDARYTWSHGIASRHRDKVDQQLLPRGRRVSLTFRQVLNQIHKQIHKQIDQCNFVFQSKYKPTSAIMFLFVLFVNLNE
jgi:hypothetical protein